MTQASDSEIRALLSSARTIAVVGLSNNRQRASNGIARFLQRSGYRVIPVNPNEAEVLQEKSYPNLLEINEAVDIVDVFRKPEFVPEIARQAVRIGAKALWLQLGVENEEAAALAAANGLAVIQDRCIMVEHLRLMGQATAGGHR